MPRPTSKIELIATARTCHAALDAFLAAQPQRVLTRPNPDTGWSIKDILAHLTAWEQMCLGWWRAGLRGEKPNLPAEGYKWSQLPALNAAIWKANHRRRYADVLLDYRASFDEIMATIDGLTNTQLFSREQVDWTGTNTLGAYFVSATSSHYDWALKLARRWVKPTGVR